MKREDLFLAIGMVEEERLAKTEITVVKSSEPHKEGTVMKKGKTMRRLITLAAVIAILSSLVITASATGLIDKIIAKLYPAEDPGKALGEAYSDSISAEKPEMFSAFGKPIDMPEMERVEVDPTQAEELLGSYVASVEGSVEAAGNTITLKDFIMDEAGFGAIIYTIENPNGVPYDDGGYGQVNLGGVPGQALLEPNVRIGKGEEEESVDCWNYLTSSREDGTALELVMYIGTLSKPIMGQPVTIEFPYGDQNESVFIEITPLSFAPVKKLTAENGKTVTLSSMGLTMECGEFKEWSTEDVQIQFTDGSMFHVEGENIWNVVINYWRTTPFWDESRGCERHRYDELALMFNRIIDPDEVSFVTIKYNWMEDVTVDEVGENTDEVEYERYVGGRYLARHHETLTYKPE